MHVLALKLSSKGHYVCITRTDFLNSCQTYAFFKFNFVYIFI